MRTREPVAPAALPTRGSDLSFSIKDDSFPNVRNGEAQKAPSVAVSQRQTRVVKKRVEGLYVGCDEFVENRNIRAI